MTTPLQKLQQSKYEKRELLKGVKIRVGHNPELSWRIQQELFRLGARWAYHGQTVVHRNQPFLFIYDHFQLTYGESESVFEQDIFREVTVKEFFDIINGKNIMKKSDLKNGQVVEHRDGKRGLVCGETIISNNCSIELCYFNEDLTNNPGVYQSDIVKVYEPDLAIGVDDILNVQDEDLIWPKHEKTELTFDQIAEKFNIPKHQIRIKDDE